MTYKEADEFLAKYSNVHLQLVEIVEPSFFIRYFLIAPVGLENKIPLLNENLYKPIDNKTALMNMKLLDKDLDVFIIGEETISGRDGEILQEMKLRDYLEATGQLV